MTHETKNEINTSPGTETSLALNVSFDIEELDRKVKSMMAFSENYDDRQKRKARICKECGKEGQMANIMQHIEANHISGPDMEFVQKFTPPDFQAKNFTP